MPEPPLTGNTGKPETRAWWLLDALLDRFRWYRRARGGHWEKWIVDVPVCADVWHRRTVCYLEPDAGGWFGRPNEGCRGTPTCEDHR